MKLFIGAILVALALPVSAQGLGSFAQGLTNGLQAGAAIDAERAQIELMEQQKKALELQNKMRQQQMMAQSEQQHRELCYEALGARLKNKTEGAVVKNAYDSNATFVRWRTNDQERRKLVARITSTLIKQPAYVCATAVETVAAAVAIVNELWPESTDALLRRKSPP